jgi:hypothetical protein
MRGVVHVVTTIGDSIIDVAFVDDADGAPRTITDAPVRTRAGIAEVTLTRVERPTRCVPRAPQDRRPFVYIALSLAAHLCVWSFAGGYTPGAPRAETTGNRYLAVHSGPVVEPSDDDHVGQHVGMRLPEPRAPHHRTPDTTAVASLDAAEIANRLAGDTAAPFAAMADEGAGGYGTGWSSETTFGGGRSTSSLEGGDGWAAIPAGRYRTQGADMGAGREWGHPGELRRDGAVPTIHLCGRPEGSANRHSCVKVVGTYDKALIRRYIRRNLDKLQYCYEKALLADPSLEGTVETVFVIAPTGRVASATATGVSPAVSSCVEDVLRAIEFPRATAAAESTEVHYPFTFRPAG